MKTWINVFLVFYAILALTLADCPPGEYNPGPNCGLEPSCAARSSHSYPKHTCDCWCEPGTYRKIDTNTCVSLSGC